MEMKNEVARLRIVAEPVVERVDSSCCFVQMDLLNNLH